MGKKRSSKNVKKGDNKALIIVIIAAVLLLALAAAVLILPDYISEKKAEAEARKKIEEIQKKYDDNMANPSSEDTMKYSDFVETDEKTEYVKLTVSGHGEMIVKLDADTAPITVDNFQSLVSKKFYDGLTFHRIMSGFMIQGGDPNGNGYGNADSTIKGEFSLNGVTNNISHKRGVISMARSDAYDSASCQFFICHGDASSSLDGKYAAFGQLVAGYKVLDSIASVEVTYNSSSELSQPVSSVVITSAKFVKLK